MFHECYVYESNSPQPTLVGRYWIEDGLGHFVYGKSWLARPDAFAIDPISLPLSEEIYHPQRGKDQDRFNALVDGGVDNWGQRLILATHRRAPQNVVEWLLATGGKGVGCLMFSASRETVKNPVPPIAMDELSLYLNVVRGVVAQGDYVVPRELVKLVENGTSMGGARPKALVLHDGDEHLAKFNRPDDKLDDLSRVEFASMRLASACGIHTAEVDCIAQGHYGSILVLRRFDRVPESAIRLHFLSAHTLINMNRVAVDDYRRDFSYMGIAKAIQKISAEPEKDAHELYRRMVFNGMIGNSDDHLRNHGFLLTDRRRGLYRLSPAFDVLPHYAGNPQMLAIGCGRQGQIATYENLLSCSEQFYLSRSEALGIIREVRERVLSYPAFFRDVGVSEHDMQLLAPCFALAHESVPSLQPGMRDKTALRRQAGDSLDTTNEEDPAGQNMGLS